jgi:four helix bundle protein
MKTTISDYRDLKVWQKSMSLCEEVYALIKMFPTEERYALCDQLRRAVVSIPSNIAEGNGRDSRTEYARFLAIARGSVFEVQTQLELAERFGYIKVPSSTQESLVEISKILYTLIRKLRTT